MSVVVLDQAASSKLTGYHAPVKVCDTSGLVLGHFVPYLPAERVQLEPAPLSDEEMAVRTSRTGGRTLTQIMADLGHRA